MSCPFNMFDLELRKVGSLLITPVFQSHVTERLTQKWQRTIQPFASSFFSLFLSVCLFICLFVCLSSVCLSLSLPLSLSLSMCLSLSLFVSLSLVSDRVRNCYKIILADYRSLLKVFAVVWTNGWRLHARVFLFVYMPVSSCMPVSS